VDAAGRTEAVPAGGQLVQEPVRRESAREVLVVAEPERERGAHEGPDGEPEAYGGRIRRAEEAEPGQHEDGDAREERLLDGRRERVARSRRRPRPDEALVGRREEPARGRRVEPDELRRPLRFRMLVDHAEVRPRLQERDENEHAESGDARRQHPAAEGGPAAAQPVSDRDDADGQQQVRELDAQREPEEHLPRRDQPAGEDERRAPPPVAAHEQEERERDPAARDDREMPRLGQPERGVRERRSRDDGGEAGSAELACEEIRPEERERVREQEEQVVDDDRGVEALRREDARRRVPQEHVREREAVLLGPEGVRLEEVERLLDERVAHPREVPRVEQGVAQVLGHVAPQVEHERPRHPDAEDDGEDRRQEPIPAGTDAHRHEFSERGRAILV
jgi:hypothetical protein